MISPPRPSNHKDDTFYYNPSTLVFITYKWILIHPPLVYSAKIYPIPWLDHAQRGRIRPTPFYPMKLNNELLNIPEVEENNLSRT
ncbi:hypothetical protein FKM82_000773 [Ascaphus truei]